MLKIVHTYMNSNLLHINSSKCFFMYFRPNIHSRNICIRTEPHDLYLKLYLNGQKIKQVSSTKFLGVIIDENLTWLPQVESLKKKLISCHGTLYRIKDSIPKTLYKSLYHALFESHLTYCISVWGFLSNSVMHEIFTIQKNCVRMLLGKESYNREKLYCYCKYGESGTMINCENCDNWFHDECLGLSEKEIMNINEFYCIECLNKNSNLSIKYNVTPLTLLAVSRNTFCYCQEGESGLMIECGKCRNWFHDECINLTHSNIKSILIYFCPCCIKKNNHLKIIYKDYIKEHTKPLFKSHHILTVYNLYTYHVLLEIYKILKFRTPYCLYEIFSTVNSNRKGLTISNPGVLLSRQKKTFIYQAIILWNQHHRKLLKPFTITLHNSHRLKFDSFDLRSEYYDFTTKVATYKTRLKDLFFHSQNSEDEINWSLSNHTLSYCSTLPI